jgi:hypothetical protein
MTDISTELREALLREMRLTSLGPNGTRDREQKARSVLVLEIGHPVYDEVESLLGVGAGRANRGGHASEPEARAVLIVEPAHPVYDEVEFLIGNAAERMSLGIVASAILEHQARMSLLGQSESQAAAFAEARPVHAITKNRTAIDVRADRRGPEPAHPRGCRTPRRRVLRARPARGVHDPPTRCAPHRTRPVLAVLGRAHRHRRDAPRRPSRIRQPATRAPGTAARGRLEHAGTAGLTLRRRLRAVRVPAHPPK